MLTPKDAILFKIVHTCANECLILTYRQWRNSYGLRVGKPAGTQAEGAPSSLVLHLKLPFEKGHHLEKGNLSTAFSNTFFIVWLQNSHIDAFHKLKKSKLGPMGGGGPSLSQKARVPFTQMFQLRLPFEKGAPFPTFCFSFFWLRNSHNDAFLKVQVEALWFGCYGVIIWFLNGKNESEWFLLFSLSAFFALFVCAIFSVHFTQIYYHVTKGVTLVYLNTVTRWTRLTRQKSKWLDSLYYTTIRTCMLVHEKTRLRPISHWTFKGRHIN